MTNDGYDSSSSGRSTAKTTRRSTRFLELLNTPNPRKSPPLGVDTAWALKLKDAINAAVRELNVQVLSAKPIVSDDDAGETGVMRFELETDRGPILATRTRDGVYSFGWK